MLTFCCWVIVLLFVSPGILGDDTTCEGQALRESFKQLAGTIRNYTVSVTQMVVKNLQRLQALRKSDRCSVSVSAVVLWLYCDGVVAVSAAVSDLDVYIGIECD